MQRRHSRSSIMGRIIVATGLIGIAVITAIAWAQANARIASCTLGGITDTGCATGLAAKRDAILTAGLSVALAFILVSLIAFAVIRARRPQESVKPPRPAKQAARPLLRS
jgi:predicted lipid-binding transport protein (Tim44 family)